MSWALSGVSLAASVPVIVAWPVFLVASPVIVPLALAALASYWRQMPAGRARTAWTVVVLALLLATAVPPSMLLLDLVG